MKFCPIAGSTALLLASLFELGCQRSAQYYLRTGDDYYAKGKYADAAINYRKSIQKLPQVAEAHNRLGLAESKQGHPIEAYQEFQQAVTLAPNRDDIRIQLADVALAIYQATPSRPKVLYDQVANTADRLLKTNPKSFDGLRIRADVLSIDNRLDEAVTTFKQADAARPMDLAVVYPMVQVLFRLNRIQEAEDLAQRFLQVHKDEASVYDLLVAQYIKDKRTGEALDLMKSKVANLPTDPESRLQLAALYRDLKLEPEMSQTLQTILNDPKKFPRGHAYVGEFFASSGKWDDALREYEAGTRANSKDRAFYQKLSAKVLIVQGERKEAIDKLNQVVTGTPDDDDARAARAFLLRESNDPKQLDLAIAELNAIIAKNPNHPIARYNLGLAYLAKNDLASARSQLSESAKQDRFYIEPRLALAEMSQKARNYGETIRWADEVLAVAPSNLNARLWKGGGLIGSKAYQAARGELDAVLRDSPNFIEANLHMAVLDASEKRYKEAEDRYLRFYKPGQKDLRPLEGLIQLYVEQRQTDRALKLLDQELKQAPDSTSVHLLLASTALRAGNLGLATNEYEWLREKDPKSIQVNVSLGEIYQLKGDVNSALKSYEKAREFAPNDPRIIAIIAYLQQTAAGQNNEAIKNLRKQLSLDPENTVALNNLAFALADTGNDLDQALSLVERAQKKAPGNAGIADTLGWVYTKKGLNDSAIQIFTALVRKYPDEPAFRYHYGVALLQKGETAEAKAEFIISLSKNPPKEMADKIKQILSTVG
jgi:tetratricopeptide (TPR) repeat protein